jgi:predicted dehydrogenase
VSQVVFGIIGGGWRADFYLRVARELPDRFRVAAMMVRDAAKGAAIERSWGIPTHRTIDELLANPELEFVVVSVPWPVTPVMIRFLHERGMPALAETPPAPDLEGLIALHELTTTGAKVQVAEQYQFQPLHAARLSIARSGRLGTVSQAQVSAAHGYHGMSLMRGLLGVRFEDATITAREFISPIVGSPTRDGPPAEERITKSRQVIAHFDFGDKLGVYDFTGDQYFSYIRSPRVLVRGERGEINNLEVRHLHTHRVPAEYELRRVDAGQYGNLEGYHHKGILAGDEWVYRNPVIPGRLTDDEVAVATCLERMAEYVDGGEGFCGLPDASQDHYLSLMIDEAVRSGEPVRTKRQPWASE